MKKYPNVFAFAFRKAGVDDVVLMTDYATGYKTTDKTIVAFRDEQVALGRSVGIFTHSEWH